MMFVWQVLNLKEENKNENNIECDTNFNYVVWYVLKEQEKKIPIIVCVAV